MTSPARWLAPFSIDGPFDREFWLRRSALLSQLPVVCTAEGDPDRFFGYADGMLAEGEFFVRKSIG